MPDSKVSSSALPTGAATETTLAGIKTGTDKIPTSPAQEHATAASPHSARLSDGSAFYDATKTGQLPAALTGSGNLKAAITEFTSAIPAGSNTIGKVEVVDGANVLDIDASGRISLQSSGTDGQAVPGKALQVGGKDTGGNLQSIAVDTTGRIITAPQTATAAANGFSQGFVVTSAASTVPVRS